MCKIYKYLKCQTNIPEGKFNFGIENRYKRDINSKIHNTNLHFN